MRYLQSNADESKVKLDMKDKKILSILEKNSRMPITQISKLAGLKRDTCDYRIKNLQKVGVIQGYRTIISIDKFGYDAYHIFLQLKRPTVSIEKEIIKKFQDHKFVRAIIKYGGKYDFEIAVIAKNIKEFDDVLNDILQDCDKYIQSYEVLIISKSLVGRVFPKKFLDKEKQQKNEQAIKINNISVKNRAKIKILSAKLKIDDSDIKILKQLSENPLFNSMQIAANTKISHDAVTYRIKSLEKTGVISKYIPIINYSAISHNIYCILLNIGSARKNIFMVNELLNKDENVLWAVKTVGKYDLIIYVCIKNTDELHSTVNSLRSYFPDNILDYEVLLAYEEYKYTYFPDYVYI